MPQQPKVIHTAKRKINASEQSMQDLIAQIAQYNKEMESLSIEKEKAMGGTEDEEEALSNAFRKFQRPPRPTPQRWKYCDRRKARQPQNCKN